MLKLLFIISCCSLEIANLAIADKHMENFMEKLKQQQFHEADLILRNITDINVIYDISKNVLNYSYTNETITKIWFLEKITSIDYKWYDKLELPQLFDLLKALQEEKALGRNPNIINLRRNLEFLMIKKCVFYFKLIILNKNYESLKKLDEALSFLGLAKIQHLARLCIKQVYGLILHSKLLKRLDLNSSIKEFKAYLFIEFFKRLKKQKALNLNLEYKLALNLRYILENNNITVSNKLYYDLVNIKLSLNPEIRSLIFAKTFCIRSQSFRYLHSFRHNHYNVSFNHNSSSLWQTHLFDDKLILENAFSQQLIYNNYLQSLSDRYLYEFHLKPLPGSNSFVLENIISHQVLCLDGATQVVWSEVPQNAGAGFMSNQSNTINNCLWSLNDCSGLKRILVNEI